ncbi:RloB family protein [Fulvivirgaceae bacterium BMA12]|uniref:RloB family protein n=1 Tax=Agaribacillus aureus TaxID=3051825 RepID=A0ABT8L5F4_9BACT|nr:RloB family protein [Fulvivirgaceae bacterium BMA12]
MARSRNTRRPNLKILILCEGKTERNYLLEIKHQLPREKQHGIKIDVDHFKRNDPLNLVIEAARRKRKAKHEGAPYDHIWVVFDHDNLPNRDKAFFKAESNSIKIAYSSFNIEFWFLLHFQYSTRQFTNGDDVKEYLRQNFISNYEPGKTRLLPILDDLFNTASNNADMLRRDKQRDINAGIQIWNLNPYVTIDELVKFIHNLR